MTNAVSLDKHEMVFITQLYYTTLLGRKKDIPVFISSIVHTCGRLMKTIKLKLSSLTSLTTNIAYMYILHPSSVISYNLTYFLYPTLASQ